MRPPYSFLICPDSVLLKEQQQNFLSAPEVASKTWKSLVFWGDEVPPDGFWESFSQISLFAENRVITIRQAENWPTATWKKLSDILGRTPDHLWPFICLECAWEKGKPKIPAHILKMPCYAWAEKKGFIWKCEGLKQANLKNFIAAKSRELGLKLSPADMATFVNSVRPDAAHIVNELKKLALLIASGKTELKYLSSFQNTESDAFRLIRLLLNGKLSDAWKEIDAAADNLLFLMTALLSREMKNLWQCLSGENPRFHPSEAAFKKNLAKKMGYKNIAECFALIAYAEFQVKSGKQTPQQSLESLCLKLAQIISTTA